MMEAEGSQDFPREGQGHSGAVVAMLGRSESKRTSWAPLLRWSLTPRGRDAEGRRQRRSWVAEEVATEQKEDAEPATVTVMATVTVTAYGGTTRASYLLTCVLCTHVCVLCAYMCTVYVRVCICALCMYECVYVCSMYECHSTHVESSGQPLLVPVVWCCVHWAGDPTGFQGSSWLSSHLAIRSTGVTDVHYRVRLYVGLWRSHSGPRVYAIVLCTQSHLPCYIFFLKFSLHTPCSLGIC